MMRLFCPLWMGDAGIFPSVYFAKSQKKFTKKQTQSFKFKIEPKNATSMFELLKIKNEETTHDVNHTELTTVDR